jgi:hypothetical protein
MQKTLGILVDNSGSMIDMDPLETVGSLNKNIQKMATDDTGVFVASFSDTYKLFINNKNKKEVNIKLEDVKPDGLTALYDAIKRICSDISEVCSKSDENDVTIIILTDGEENASQTTNIGNVRKLLNQKQEIGWKFIFLGANQDAIITGSKLGINKNTCCTYNATSGGLDSALNCTQQAIQRSVERNEQINFTTEERMDSMDSVDPR